MECVPKQIHLLILGVTKCCAFSKKGDIFINCGHKGYGRSKERLIERHNDIIALYESGMDEKEISIALGFKSPSTVYGVIKRLAPVEIKENHFTAVCPVCGKSFLKKKKYRKYCSDACADSSRATANARKRALFSSQIIDSNIALSEVYKRNNGVCYICGKECDYSDVYIKAGRKIYGKNYPN